MKHALALALLTAAVALPAHAERTLTGTIVDPQGRPIEAAAVWLAPAYDLADEPYDAYVKAGPAAVTGADGGFTVSLPAGAESVDVCAPGSLTESVDVRVAAAGPITVKLRPGGRISGRVIDSAGDPIAGMYVRTQRAGNSTGRDWFPRESPCPHGGTAAGGQTDREGRFDLAPLEPGWYTVWAGEGSIATLSAPVDLGPGQALDGMRLIAKRGAQVAGRVTTKDGSPASEARVFSGGASTITDAAGHYQLTGMAPGPHRIWADERQHGTIDCDVELAAGENRLDLVLPDPTEIRGRVLGPGGAPVAGAIVKIWPARTVTSADGNFGLSTPTCGCPKTIAVHAAGLAPAEAEIRGQPGALEIHLTRPGAVVGRVLGLRSPADTQITAAWGISRRRLKAVADAGGRFHLSGLTPGKWTITASKEGRVRLSNVDVAPGEEKAVDIAFPATHRVSGWVADEHGRPASCDEIGFNLPQAGGQIHVPCRGDGTFDAELEDGSYDPWVGIGGHGQFHKPLTVTVAGAPITGVEIRLLAWITVEGRILGLEPSEVPDSIEAKQIGQVQRFDGTAGRDGRYSIEILSGDWEIRARFGAMTARRRLHVPADATRIDADLAFFTGPHVLTGRVVGKQAFLELVGPDGFSITTSVSAEGRFHFSHLAAGTYRLRALRSNPAFRDLEEALTRGMPSEGALIERIVQVPSPADADLVVDLGSL
jgi:protocatechuate 3,4-dioxygenase beta subunit